MSLPVSKAGLIGLSALFALVAAVAVFLYSSGGSAEAASYDPDTTVEFCNQLEADFPSTKPGFDSDLAGNPACSEGTIPASTAGVDLTVGLVVPGAAAGGDAQNDDSNFGSSVVTNVPGTTATDAAIDDGAKVGGLRSDITLGLLNGPCATALVAEFVLFDASTSGSLTVNPEGTEDRWGSDNAANGIVTDADSNEIADSTSAFVTTNPSIYNDLFTTDGGIVVTPKARYTGATVVPTNGDWQLLSFFQFDAGGLDAFKDDAADTPSILGRVSHAPSDGSLSLSILNDPTAVRIAIGPIHDFCGPLLVQTMLLGTASSGQTRYTTPAAGTAGISQVSFSQRDADGDGFENSRDTCPFAANSGSDTDFDGIDNACDTNLPTAAGGDVDNDGFDNRQDNCPQTVNGGDHTGDGHGHTNGPDQLDSEIGATYASAAPDGGPQGDSIGDQCDPSPTTASGQGAFVQSYNMIPKCIGGGDGDGDGYCTAQDPDDTDAGITGFTLNKGMDWEYDALNGHGDAVGGNLEVYFGSDPSDACGPGAWAFDLKPNNSINIFDVLELKAPFGSAVTDNSKKKFDFKTNLSINIFDVLELKAPFGTSCTP